MFDFESENLDVLPMRLATNATATASATNLASVNQGFFIGGSNTANVWQSANALAVAVDHSSDFSIDIF